MHTAEPADTEKNEPMELRHLRYFLAVCEEMNFTKAADKLQIAQPPLSRQIKDLEDELGAPLFTRAHHMLKLTDEGILFRQYAERIVNMAEKSVMDIHEMHSGLQGTLYISGVEGKAPRLISSWISAFSEQYPNVQYSLWNGNSDEVTNRVRKGLCDIGVIMEPFDPQGLHSVAVYSEPWIAMFSSKHPLASIPGDTVPLSELADYNLIIPSRESRLQEINDWFAPFGKTPTIRARIAHVLNAYELSANNVGVVIFPAAAADIVSDENVRIKTIVDPSFMASYLLIYSNEHALSPVAAKFVEFLHNNVDLRYKVNESEN